MQLSIEVLADRWEDEQNFFYQQNLDNMKKNTKVTKTMKAKKVTTKKATKKVVAKKTKAVAKKKTARVTLKDKYTNQYKIVKQ